LFIAYCLGNVIGPQLFLVKESPVYQTGLLSIMICYAIGICACATLWGYLTWVNKKRERLNGGSGDLDENGYADPLVDRTDK
jgi:ACS family allantoate permease-like MFS transporter